MEKKMEMNMEMSREENRNISNFLDGTGKIIQLSSKSIKRIAILTYLAEKFEVNRNYTEKEVNTICEEWHTFGDYFLLRRELIDHGLLCSEQNGSRYWKPQVNKEEKTMVSQAISASINTTFHPIMFDEWDRKQYFYYFTQMLPTGFSMSVEVDITNTYETIKRQNRKFFPAYLYIASKLIEQQQEFRIANIDGQLGFFEVLHPSYACFHQDDNTMSNMWTEYTPEFDTFYNHYMEDQTLYAKNHGILAKPDMPPQNSCMIGMLPWIQFTSYSPVPYAMGNVYFPVIQAGKFFDRDGRKKMPLSFTVHHAVADGYHVSKFFDEFEKAMNHPEEWM